MPFIGSVSGAQGYGRSASVGFPIWVSSGSLGTLTDTQRASGSTFTVSASAGPGAVSVSYSVVVGSLPAGASLNSGSGVISGFSAVASNTTSNFTLRATNNAGLTADAALSITINAVIVTWNSPAAGALTTVTRGTSGNIALSASATSGTISYSTVSGALPSGRSISGSNITGTYAGAGSYSFTIRATSSSAGATADRAFTQTVNGLATVYNYNGGDQNFAVPAGVTQIQVVLWGAGGTAGGISSAGNDPAPGGGGGSVSGTLAVSPSENLTIRVGGVIGTYQQANNGQTSSPIGTSTAFPDGGTYGQGDGAGANGSWGGYGGGGSAIFRGGTRLCNAGGGGGGGGPGYPSTTGTAGFGGGQGQGGSGGSRSSGPSQPGGASPTGFGGGGGGGGSGSSPNSGSGQPGGGGNNSTSGLTAASSFAGTNGGNPGNTGNPNWASPIGVGQDATNGQPLGQPNGNGRIVIIF